MKIWQSLAFVEFDQMVELAVFCEELGFHGVSYGDHLVTTAEQIDEYEYGDQGNIFWDPDTHWPDPWVMTAALAQATKTLNFLSTIYILPLRDPLNAAKAISTAAYMSGDRITLGIGVGWQKAEFDMVGQDFHTRGKRSNEMLTVMRRLMSGEMTEFKGEYYEMANAVCAPRPLGLRLWIGGRGKKRTVELAAKFADGFNMPYVPADVAADRLQRLAQACEAIGRDPAELDTSVNLGFYMNSDRTPDIDPRGSLTGSVQEAVDTIGALQDVGIQGVNIAFRPPVDWDNLQCYIEEVMPHFAT